MEPSDPRRPTRRRQLLAVLCLALVILLVSWWTGLLAQWPRAQASQALRSNHLDEAEARIQQALRLEPRSGESFFLLARIQRKQGRMEEFERSLQRAVALGFNPREADNERLLARAQAGEVASIQSQLDDLLVRGGADGREVLQAYVNGCLMAARLKQAQSLIDGWSEAFPEDPQPDYYRGRLLMHYAQNEKAAKQFEDALRKQPDHHAAAYLLGQILMQQNRPQEALERFRQCDGLKYNAAPRIAQAKALRALGRVDEARSILKTVVERPEEEIRRSFQRVGDRFEGAPAHLELGSLESAAGRYAEALHWLKIAVDANPRDLSARHARGIALRGAGRHDEGVRELEAVREARLALREVDRLSDLVDNNPSLVDERVRIGELYLTYESSLTGEFWLKSALARDPHHQRAHELLAQLYESRTAEDPAYEQLARQHARQAQMHAENTLSTDSAGSASAATNVDDAPAPARPPVPLVDSE